MSINKITNYQRNYRVYLGIKNSNRRLWREYAISKKIEKKLSAAAALTRDLINEPSKYPNRKMHNIHCKIGQSCTAYTTWAQATQYRPTLHQKKKKSVNHAEK